MYLHNLQQATPPAERISLCSLSVRRSEEFHNARGQAVVSLPSEKRGNAQKCDLKKAGYLGKLEFGKELKPEICEALKGGEHFPNPTFATP